MASIGEVFVSVKLDTSGLAAEARAGGTKAGDEAQGSFTRAFNPKATAKINADTTAAKAQIDELKRKIAGIGGNRASVKAKVALDDARANAQISELRGRLLDLRGAKVKIKGDTKDIDADIAKVKAEIATIGQGRTSMKAKLGLDTALANTELNKLKAELDSFGHSSYTATASVNTREGQKGFGALVTAGIALGPALIPVLGAATVGVAALGSALVSAGGAGGVFGIAVAGQIAAMKKSQTAISATSKSLSTLTKGTPAYAAKLKELNAQQKTFNSTFGPAAKGFDDMKTAFAGFLGATQKTTVGVIGKSLEGVASILPKLAPLANAAGKAVGGLVDDLVRFSKGNTFAGVLSFFQRTGPAAITSFGHSLGNIAVGVGGVVAAFAPFQGTILHGIEGLTAKFAAWGKQLGASSGFKSFISYIKGALPGVGQFLAQLATSVGHLLQALAPLGHIELAGLTGFLNVINTLPIGVLTAAAAALTVFAVGVKAVAVAAAIGGAKSNITALGTNIASAGKGALAAKAGFLAAGVGLAVLNSKIDDSHTTTKAFLDVASGAAMGAAFGPIGALAGAAAGGLQAYSAQTQSAAAATAAYESAAQSVAATLDQTTGAFTKATTAQAEKTLVDQGGYKAAQALGLSFGTVTQAALGSKPALAAVSEAIKSIPSDKVFDGINFTDAGHAAAVLTQILRPTNAAINATRQGIKDTAQANADLAGSVAPVSDAQGKAGAAARSAAASLQAEAAAAAATAASNNALKDSLLSAIGGWIGFRDSVRQAIAATKGVKDIHIFDGTAKGDKFKAMLVGVASNFNNLSNAAQKAPGALQTAQQSFVKVAQAMGLTQAQAQAVARRFLEVPTAIAITGRAAQQLAHDFNALPKTVRTDIKTHGAPESAAQVQALTRKYNLTPKQVQTILEARDNATVPINQVRKLMGLADKSKATPKVDANTQSAAAKIQQILGQLKGLAGQHPTPTLDANPAPATAQISKVQGELAKTGGLHPTPTITAIDHASGPAHAAAAAINSVNSKSVTLTITTVRTQINRTINQLNPFHADGGYISGPGGPRDDKIPSMLSNGEFVMNAAATKRNLPALFAMNAQKFAAGGVVQKGLKHFDITSDQTRADSKSELATLFDILKKALGKGSPLLKHLQGLGDRLLGVQKSQDHAAAVWDKSVARLEKVRKEARQYARSVSSAYQHDVFGGSLDDFSLQLRADRNDANQADKDLARAKHRGLSGQLLKQLQASGNTALIAQFSHLSRAEIQHEEALFRARNRATRHLGNDSAQAVYGKSIKEQTRETKHLHHAVLLLNRRLAHIERDIRQGAREGVGDANRKAHVHRKAHH